MKDTSLELNAKLVSVHPLVNGSFSLIFRTIKLENEEKSNILYYHTKNGYLSFTQETDKEQFIGNEQTNIQRLKAQLKFKYDSSNIDIPFEEWYNSRLVDIIKYIKEDKI